MEVQLKYGRELVTLALNTIPERIKGVEPEKKLTEYLFRQKFLYELERWPRSFTTVGIVVADKTRLCNYPSILPWVEKILIEKGVATTTIDFYVAYGTHKKQTEEESLAAYGEIYNRYSFIHHDSTASATLKKIGTTKRGTEVVIQPKLDEYDLLITIGAISYHYFAGFGGGRKLIFPGLAEKDSIQHNHHLFLDPQIKQLARQCQPGVLDGNPIAEDFKEMDSIFPKRLSVHGILNSSGEVCDVHIGSSYEDFLEACQMHHEHFGVETTTQYNLVVSSGGGYPKDINFIQAHKAIHHSSLFLKDGGTLLIFLECLDGVGSDPFMNHFRFSSYAETFEHLYANYGGNGGTALSMMEKTARIKIKMVTNLSDEVCQKLHVEKLTIQQAQEFVGRQTEPFGFISNASVVIPK